MVERVNGVRRGGEHISGDIEYFNAYTLIDITDSGVTNMFDQDQIGYHQAQNLNVILQTVGLRSQPTIVSVREMTNQTLSEYNFGSDFTALTNQQVWLVKFTSEHKGSWKNNNDNTYHLVQDCNGVAVTDGLANTATFDTPVFNTTGPAQLNLYFEQTDVL